MNGITPPSIFAYLSVREIVEARFLRTVVLVPSRLAFTSTLLPVEAPSIDSGSGNFTFLGVLAIMDYTA